MKAIVAAEQFKTSDYVEMLESVRAPGLKHRIKVSGAPHPDWLQFGDIAGLGGADDRRRVREISKSLDCRDPINIQFTSGTTGLPKGATLSHRNILNNVWFVGCAQQLTAGDRICVPVPLYHCFGLV